MSNTLWQVHVDGDRIKAQAIAMAETVYKTKGRDPAAKLKLDNAVELAAIISATLQKYLRDNTVHIS